jgi:hypothetical protein
MFVVGPVWPKVVFLIPMKAWCVIAVGLVGLTSAYNLPGVTVSSFKDSDLVLSELVASFFISIFRLL